jgi:phosphoglycolate phosphatase-like HAD superfamily hydrolase
MIGDSESDMEAGRAVGARVIRIGLGVRSLAEAVSKVIGEHS